MFELPAEQSPRAIIVAMTRMPAAPEKDLDAANAASAGAGQDGEPSTRDAVADEQLMLAYAAGDVAAFERLYDRHEGPVYRFLLRSIGVPGVAEELLQEVWLAVVRTSNVFCTCFATSSVCNDLSRTSSSLSSASSVARRAPTGCSGAL